MEFPAPEERNLYSSRNIKAISSDRSGIEGGSSLRFYPSRKPSKSVDLESGFRLDYGYSLRTFVGLIPIAVSAGSTQANSEAIPSTSIVKAMVIGS
jgi:hypothetical protein